MRFRGAWLNGEKVDLVVEGSRVRTLEKHDEGAAPGDVEGGLLCPHLAEPHVHLDATQLGTRAPNLTGTLQEGIANWARLRADLTVEDVRARALQTVRWYVAHGTTRIRTHVDTAGRPAAEALLALRDELKDPACVGVPVELQVVAFPQEGLLRAPGQVAEWEAVVALGCDAVGAIPHFENSHEDGAETVRMAFALAERHGIQVDLHCDETDDPAWRNLEVVCEEALARGLEGRVVAGHCTAMHSYPNDYADVLVGMVAEAGVQVVANPLDNIVLQGRGDRYPKRRGITRVDELWAAGATVGIGHDSVVDPWYRLGTANLLDAASMLVHVGHLTGEAEMYRVFSTLYQENHLPFGTPPVIEAGGPATFLWFAAFDPIEALRTRARPRVFFEGCEVEVAL